MRIAVRLDRLRLMRWHLILIDGLRQQGHAVGVRFCEQAEPIPASLRALLKFESMRFRLSDRRLSARVELPAAETSNSERGDPDLTIDLSGVRVSERSGGRVVRPLYNGMAGDDVLFHTLLSGRAPALAVEDSADGHIWPIGHPAIEQPERVTISLDQALSRLVEGLLRVVSDIAAGQQAPRSTSQQRLPDASQGSMLSAVAGFGQRAIASKLSRLRDHALGEAPRWRVAWRMTDTDATSGSVLQIRDFHLLPDDGQRFFADPFVLARDGLFHVFVEELPHDSGVGLISHFTISETGEATAPRPVLQTETHLSYPFVFEHDGETWMMPESSASGGLDLYRCTRFPDVWTHEAKLLEGRFHDATLFAHEGRLWIAAATDVLQSSTWDALSFFYADTLAGPWTPHAGNPMLIDARSARPAGPLWRSGGDLIRPAQDCSDGYGRKLRLRKILRLTPTEFAEETVGTLCFNPEARISGPHTICRAGRLEIIDLFAKNRDLSNAQHQPTRR
jgi:hypothetical protein